MMDLGVLQRRHLLQSSSSYVVKIGRTVTRLVAEQVAKHFSSNVAQNSCFSIQQKPIVINVTRFGEICRFGKIKT